METPEQYYNTPASHGSYQFTTLKDIVDEMMMNRLEPDSYVKNTNRNLFILHAKNGIKKMTAETSAGIFAIEMTVGEDSYITLPQDYVSHVRVSVVVMDSRTGKRYLHPLDINSEINTATGYLQDNDAKILFDDDGNIITADASNIYNIPYKSYEFTGGSCGGNAFFDTSVLSEFGEYTIDENNGKLGFSDNLINKEIVLEYQSDGLQWEYFADKEIKVHKKIEEAVKDWTYYACIERRVNVPMNEKIRALNRYKTTLFQTKKKMSGLDLKAVSKLLRSKSKYL